MKNHRFDRYLYMGITAVLVLAAAWPLLEEIGQKIGSIAG